MANPFDDVVLGIAEHMATWQSRTAQDVLLAASRAAQEAESDYHQEYRFFLDSSE